MGRQRRIVISTRIAGFKHHEGATARLQVLQFMASVELRLVPEPKNPHDPNAVAVHDQRGLKLGYVPKDISEKVAGYICDPDIYVHASKTTGTFNEMTIEATAGDPLG